MITKCYEVFKQKTAFGEIVLFFLFCILSSATFTPIDVHRQIFGKLYRKNVETFLVFLVFFFGKNNRNAKFLAIFTKKIQLILLLIIFTKSK